VTDWESAKTCDTERFGKFFRGMLERGIYLAPSQFEAAFVSAAHSEEEHREDDSCGTGSVVGQAGSLRPAGSRPS